MNYYQVRLGQQNKYADECYKKGFFGVGFLGDVDISNDLTEDWRDFNRKFIPVYLSKNPYASRVKAGLACGNLWQFAKGIKIGDIILSPCGNGDYYVGEVIGDYEYHPDVDFFNHRRKIKWFNKKISKDEFSEALYNSMRSGTITSLTERHAQELDSIVFSDSNKIIAQDKTIEDVSIFALEKHLEDFLVENWNLTELGQNYDIYEEDGEKIGQQYQTDTGPIDILAISKDRKTLLVIELKKGRATDVVVGQCLRYMGYVKDEIAEKDQNVRGVIIAFDDDLKLRRALSAVNNIEFYRYEVNFNLRKSN